MKRGDVFLGDQEIDRDHVAGRGRRADELRRSRLGLGGALDRLRRTEGGVAPALRLEDEGGLAPFGAGDVLGLGDVIVRASFEDPANREATRSPAPTGFWGSSPTLPDRPQRPWNGVPATSPQEPSFQAPARFPTETTGRELAPGDPALAMLLSHFSQMQQQMQQQMMDQFQQQQMMMMQMFMGMHKEQMGLFREEMDRLRELTVEIASIKAQLAARPGLPPPPAPPWGNAAPAPLPWGNTARPGSAAPPPTNGTLPYAPPRRGQPVPPPRPPHSAGGFASPGPAPQPPRPLEADAPMEPNGNAHEWLNDRLVVLEDEQRGLMQKIGGLLRRGS